MNWFKAISVMSVRRKAAFFLAVYFFLTAFLPFSHAHAIEESNLGNLYVVDNDQRVVSHESHHNHRHDKNHRDHSNHHREDFSDQCCQPIPTSDDHHHFISEFFHYFSERRKLLNSVAATVFCVIPFSSASLNSLLRDPAESFCQPATLEWFSSHFCRRVSGNSPPSTHTVLSE